MGQRSCERFQECIYQLVRQIPAGRVATYGQVAVLCGRPRHARFVGYALYQVAPDSDIPWHRVVNAQGKVSVSPRRGGSDELQRWRLTAEGVVFSANGRINLGRYGWQPALGLIHDSQDNEGHIVVNAALVAHKVADRSKDVIEQGLCV